MLVFCCIVVMTGSGWGARCVSCAHVFAHAHQHVHTRKHTNNMAQVLKKSCKGRERKNREETEAQNNTWERSNHQIKIRAQGKRQTKKKASRDTEGWGGQKPRSVADYDIAISLIFCPSCRGSQEQLQWQGSICSAIPLLHSQSRSIINDTEKQGRSCRARCPAHAGPTGVGELRLRGMVREGEGTCY